MNTRITISSGTKWEEIAGYSRLVRVSNVIELAGTTAVDETGVVRTRMFVTDISRWEEIARAHGEVFREIKPASTMVEAKALISSELLVEIEASAILED
jgi:enamine deaminase RidA (YjgF/YER057c/UK114 family)